MTGNQLWIFAFFVGCGIAMFGLRWWADRSERARITVRDWYTDKSHLFHMRTWIITAPIIGTGCILLGLTAILPTQIGAWLFIPVILFLAGGFLLTYRAPRRLVPRWMREKQEAGRLEVARPDRMDWVFFWIVLPFVVLGAIGVVLLIVVFDSVQP